MQSSLTLYGEDNMFLSLILYILFKKGKREFVNPDGLIKIYKEDCEYIKHLVMLFTTTLE